MTEREMQIYRETSIARRAFVAGIMATNKMWNGEMPYTYDTSRIVQSDRFNRKWKAFIGDKDDNSR